MHCLNTHHRPSTQPSETALREAAALLPGENPESPYVEDAVHWVTVYEALIVFDRNVLADADEAPVPTSLEELVDLAIREDDVRCRIDRHQERRRFWRDRVIELVLR